MPKHTSELLKSWVTRGGSKSQRRWWRLIPSCILWSVWKERNGRCSENRSNSVHKVKWNCIVSLLFWCKQLCIVDNKPDYRFDRKLVTDTFQQNQHALNIEEYNLTSFKKNIINNWENPVDKPCHILKILNSHDRKLFQGPTYIKFPIYFNLLGINHFICHQLYIQYLSSFQKAL